VKTLISIAVLTLALAAGCADPGEDELEKKDLATRVGDAVESATARAEQLTEEENKRVEEVNEAMDQ
jgi:hypothetical protein